ncbi:MAG: CPBP family intramembrane metalloprotease [Erysipelotrichaceae bacterium]|nr:CPBP family intramembrane metalloprotease [Erysipelotrichaceae bacterium]
MKQLFILDKKNLLFSFGLGAFVYFVIMSAYFIFRNMIDLNTIQNALLSNVGVSAENFLFVALYISFINSFLEEFFFRGYAFILLKDHVKPSFAYLFSASLFAFYHVGMTISWFHPVIYVLAMLGLLLGGMIFNALNDRFGTIYSSWIVHMFANFAINTVGFILFGIL